MKKIIVNHTNDAVTQSYALPIFRYQKKDHGAYHEGEETMSKTEERQIYCRLAKEIIETRLGVEPTELRIEQLANTMQAIEDSQCAC